MDARIPFISELITTYVVTRCCPKLWWSLFLQFLSPIVFLLNSMDFFELKCFCEFIQRIHDNGTHLRQTCYRSLLHFSCWQIVGKSLQPLNLPVIKKGMWYQCQMSSNRLLLVTDVTPKNFFPFNSAFLLSDVT